jgi:tyrosinase
MPVITTGVPHGRTVSRLELRNFLKDKDLTNLYLLAMDRMQRKDQNSPTSWYQLASIHGRYVAYSHPPPSPHP